MRYAGAAPGRRRTGRRGAQASASRHKAFPATSWRPRRIRNKEGRGLRVFTPFWRRVQASAIRLRRCPPRKSCRLPKLASDGSRLASRTAKPDWAGGLRESGRPARARRRRGSRISRDRVAGYAIDRDRPDRDGTSGCRRICASARSRRARSGTPRASRPSARLPATSRSS